MLRKTIFMLLLAATGSAVADAGNPYLQYDRRVAITVDSHERNHVLFDMRELLHGLFHIQSAMARNELKAIPEVAMSMGRVMQHMPSELLIRVPDEYKHLGAGMQATFTYMAEAAKADDHKKVESYLAEAMTYCSGCHDTFRFQIGKVVNGK